MEWRGADCRAVEACCGVVWGELTSRGAVECGAVRWSGVRRAVVVLLLCLAVAASLVLLGHHSAVAVNDYGDGGGSAGVCLDFVKPFLPPWTWLLLLLVIPASYALQEYGWRRWDERRAWCGSGALLLSGLVFISGPIGAMLFIACWAQG